MSRAMGAGRTERRQRFDYCLNACRLHAGGQWVHDELLDAGSLNKSSLKVGGFQQDHGLSQSLADEKLKNPTHTHIVDQLDHPSFQADCASYGALLRACTRAKALSHGLRIHDHIIKTGLEQNVYLNNLIIDMYGRGDGSMPMAHALFAKMSHPDLFSWNFMIRAYAHNGLYKEALELFQQLLWQGMMLPDQYIYVSILSVCASIKAITQGKQLHIQISSSGFELEVIVATALINMYGKCGSLVDAWKVFNKMPQRDAVSWNTMIAACVLHGHSKDAIQLFKQLHEEGEVPNKATFTTILDACLLHEALLEGKHIHACIAAREFESDLVVRTALSNMYSKCTTMESSQSMPDTTKEPNGLLQGTLLTTYAQQGLIQEALQLFEQMQLKEILPDKYGFVSMISSCASQAAFAEGEQMHAYVAGTRMEIDVVVGTALISMYGKSGKPEVARTLFDKMPIHDVVSWTAMIAAYSQNGKGKDALELFKQMKQKGLEPNKVTFATIFDACTSEDFLAEGRHVHQDILGSKLELDVYVGTALVNMYGRFRCLEDARMIFDKMASHDVIAWNAIIAALAHNEEGARALQLFRQMQEQGMMPNKITFISTFDACTIHLALPEGKRIHAQVVVNKLESDIVLGTALINMYGRCGCLENARRIFDAILKRDIVSWTAIMAAYAHYGQIKEAFKLFDEMQHAGLVPDKVSCISILSACVSKTGIDEGRQMHTRVVACGLDLDVSVTNGLITMYDKCGSVEDAMRTFEKMLGRDRDTYVSILFACTNQLDLAEGRKMHTRIVKTGYELEVPVGNALINMFSKCGSLQEAGMVFETMPERDVVSWTIMIASYAQHGHGEYALQLFDQMQKEGLFPNMVTFVNILNAFSHAGMVDEGFRCFGYISQNQITMSPIEDHYNCIVDLLGRAGRLSEAEHFIRKMPFPPSVVSWTSLLNACRHHVDVERGERAAEHVFRMEPDNPAPYITMYNLYTTVRRVDDAAMVIYRLKEKGLLEGEVAACVT